MDETRFTRLETRVDEIKDDVAEIKAEQKVSKNSIDDMRDDLKQNTELVKEHVTSDNKIIQQIQPLLNSLPEVHDLIEEFKFERLSKRRRREKAKDIALKIGIPGAILGLILTTLKILSYF